MTRLAALGLVAGALGCGGTTADPTGARREASWQQHRAPTPGVGGAAGGASEQVDDVPGTAGALSEESGAPEPSEDAEPPQAGCGTTYVEQDCDERWTECEPGTHRDFVDGGCSTCVPDDEAPRTCAWARERYPDFISELTEASCAAFCDEDSDCFPWTLSNDCATGCTVVLRGAIDEEILEAAQSFSDENCAALCGSTPPPACEAEAGSVACVNHRCTFVDEP